MTPLLVFVMMGLLVGAFARHLLLIKAPGGYFGIAIASIVGGIMADQLGRFLGYGGLNGFDLRSLFMASAGMLLVLGLFSLVVRKYKSTAGGAAGRDKERTQRREKVIFISYRRSDSSDVTGRMFDRLESRFGRASVFRDVDSVPPGINFKAHITNLVSACSVLLVVIGKNWLGQEAGSQFRSKLHDPEDLVRLEIEVALKNGIFIIPVLVQGATMPAEKSLPPALLELRARNWIKVRSDPDFHNDMQLLISGVEAHL